MLKKIRKNSEVPAALRSIDIKAVLRRRGVFKAKKLNQELKEAAIPIAKQLLKAKQKTDSPEPARRHAQFTNETLDKYWQKQIAVVEAIEQRFEKKVEQFINRIGEEFLKQLDATVDQNSKSVETKDFFSDNEEELLVKAQLDFKPLLDTVATLSGEQALRLLGLDDPYLGIDYKNEIAKNIDQFTQSMIDTDRDHLVSIVNNGIENGQSIPEIRRQIVDDFDDYSKMQANRITRTEVLRVSNQAALDAFKESGVVEAKQWLTAGAIDECAQYEGKIEDLDGDFYGDTNAFKDGNPPLHPNCRCVIIPVVVGTKGFQRAPILERDVLNSQIKELESKIDKRTKDFRDLKQRQLEDAEYIKELEGLLDEKRADSEN